MLVFSSTIFKPHQIGLILSPILCAKYAPIVAPPSYTSILTITEVSHLAIEKQRQKLLPDTVTALDKLWNDRNLLTIIDLNRAIADLARDLSRQAIPRNWALRAPDAIHLASAYWLKQRVQRPLHEIHTYDDKLCKFDALIDIPICAPYATQSSLPGISQDSE